MRCIHVLSCFVCSQDLPFDVSVCVFVLEQALSVRALQEMVSAKSPDTVSSYSLFTLFYLLYELPLEA